MDSTQAFNAPEEVAIGGETFLLSQLKTKEWAALQGWIKSRNPSPLVRAARAIEEAEATGQPMPRGVQEILLAQAQEAALRWPPRPGSWHWFNLLDATEDGSAEFLRVVIVRHRPGFTLADAQALLARVAEGEMAEVVRVSTFGDPPAPKAPTAATAGEGAAVNGNPSPSPTTGRIAATN